jgi:hypothetical protein
MPILLALAVTLLLLGPTGCSSTDADGAVDRCRQALPDKTIASASATTVGKVRTHRDGSAPPPRNAFRGTPDDAAAAWCWTQDDDTTFTAYAVTDGASREFGTVEGLTETPTGPPMMARK